MKKRNKTSELQKKILTTFDATKTFILNKYYNIYMNKLDISGVDYQQKDKILKTFWETGTIAGFPMKGTKGSKDYPEGYGVFCQYSAVEYNINDWPINVTLINKRGVDFIPATMQKVDKDVVIGFAQRTKKPIFYTVEFYAKKIALCEAAIQTQLLAQKMPFLLGTNPDNKAKMENLVNNLLDDMPAIYLDADDINALKVLITGANFSVDKLEAQKQVYENKLRESLGFDNLGVGEKKEHLINSEIAANDEVTQESGSIIVDCMNEWAAQYRKIFNVSNFAFTWKETPKIEKQEADNIPEEEDEI